MIIFLKAKKTKSKTASSQHTPLDLVMVRRRRISAACTTVSLSVPLDCDWCAMSCSKSPIIGRLRESKERERERKKGREEYESEEEEKELQEEKERAGIYEDSTQTEKVHFGLERVRIASFLTHLSRSMSGANAAWRSLQLYRAENIY